MSGGALFFVTGYNEEITPIIVTMCMDYIATMTSFILSKTVISCDLRCDIYTFL